MMVTLKIFTDMKNHYKLSYNFFIFVLYISFHMLALALVSPQTLANTTMSINIATHLKHKPDPLDISYIPKEWLDLSYTENTQFLQTLRQRFHDEMTNWCRNFPYAERLLCLEVSNRSPSDAFNWIDYIPHNQSVIGKLPQFIVEEAMQKVQFDCLNACHDDFVAKLLIYGEDVEYDYVINALKGGGLPCLRSILRASRRQLNQYRDFMSTCQNQTPQNHHSHSGLLESESLIIERISSLENMTSKQHVSGYPLQGIDASIDENDIKNLEQQDICSEYKIGEERILSVPFLKTKALFMPFFFQLQSHYKVRRTSVNKYIASVALEFFPSLSYSDERVPKGQLHEYYIEEIRRCMREAGPKLRGPHGQELIIQVEDAQKTKACSPTYSIQVHNFENLDYNRSFFMAYHIDITVRSCSGLLHEFLHLFGFGDGYESQLTRFVPKGLKNFVPEASVFDCRVVQTNNIMSNWEERWYNVFTKNKEVSLIDPAYFNAILYGNCSSRDDVKLFRECDALSFQSSLMNPSCLKKKSDCERQNLLGRDKNKELEALNNELREKQRDFDESDQGNAHKDSLIQEIQDLKKRIDLVKLWPD